MATLERRVQILFDPAQYAALEQEAAQARQSVASLIRESVDERLRRPRTGRSEALARLLASSDAPKTYGPIDWETEKTSFERSLP